MHKQIRVVIRQRMGVRVRTIHVGSVLIILNPGGSVQSALLHMHYCIAQFYTIKASTVTYTHDSSRLSLIWMYIHLCLCR